MYVSVHICNDPLRKFRPRCNLSYAIIHQLFSPAQALNGFMMMITQTRKLLFFTKNASEYLGHSMEDLLIHGDSIYDIIDMTETRECVVQVCILMYLPQSNFLSTVFSMQCLQC